MKTEIVSFAESLTLKHRPDADLLLTKPFGAYDVKIIKFPTRKSLEAFNKKANLNAVVKTQVPIGAVIYKHESDDLMRSL